MRFSIGLVVAGVALVASGCIDSAKPRSYSCSADSGVPLSEQCPGAGWICGLEGICRDPKLPGDFQCARDAGVAFCADGWFCTVEGRCRSRDAGGEFPCSRSNPAGDPKDGGQPNDCGNPRWWCGAAGECQQLGVEKAYACAVDNDCEGSFRCSPDGVCIPPPPDRLDPTAFGTIGTPSLRSPLVSAVGATHLAVGTPFTGDLPDGGTNPLPLVVAFPDGGISAFLRYYPAERTDGTLTLGTLQVAPSVTPTSNVVDLAFAESRAYTIRVSTDGGYTFEAASAAYGPGGVPTLTAMQKLADLPAPLMLDAGFELEPRLRMSNRVFGKVVAFTPVGLVSHEGFPATDFTPLPGPAGTDVGFDLAWVPVKALGIFDEGAFVLSTYKGLFFIREKTFSKLSESSWYALGGPGLTNRLCGQPASVPPEAPAAALQLRTISHNVFAALVSTAGPNNTPTFGLSLYIANLPKNLFSLGGSNGGPTDFPEVFADGGCEGPANNITRVVGPCDPCPANFPRMVDFRPAVQPSADGGYTLNLEARCEQPSRDGGAGPQRTYALDPPSGFTGGQCSRSLKRIDPEEGRFLSQSANTQKVGRVETTRGNIFLGDFEDNVEPLFMDQPPVTVIEARSDGGTLLAGSNFLALEQPNLGLLTQTFPVDATTGRSSSVDGHPSWIASLTGVTELTTLQPTTADGGLKPPEGRTIAFGIPASSAATVPTNGVVLRTSDGGQELALSAFDSIYSADVTNVVNSGTAESVLELRSIPFARSPILTLAAGTPAPDAGLYALAYANTQNGLFEVRAETKTRWRASDVILPEEVVQVFANGAQARAGLVSGRVASLPSRLIISEPLPESVRPAVSYAGVCGQPWVLAAGGLFRLKPVAGSAVGSWEHVVLQPGAGVEPLPLFSPSDLYARGRLHFHGGRFWIFLADGTTYTAEVSCPNGP